MTIWNIIEEKKVPDEYVERYKQSNPKAANLPTDHISKIIVRRVIDNLELVLGFLDMEIESFEKNNTKEDTEFAKNCLYSYAFKHIGLFNDEFPARLQLLAGSITDRETFTNMFEKDIYKTFNKYHEVLQEVNQSREVERNLGDENPSTLKFEYARDLYQLENDPTYLLHAPKRIKKMMAKFAKGSIELLTHREQELAIINSGNATSMKSIPKSDKQSCKTSISEFEEVFIPPYDQHIDNFVDILYKCDPQVITNDNKWIKGANNGIFRIFLETLKANNIIEYSKTRNTYGKIFAKKFIGIDEGFIDSQAKDNSIVHSKCKKYFQQEIAKCKQKINSCN